MLMDRGRMGLPQPGFAPALAGRELLLRIICSVFERLRACRKKGNV